MNKIAIKLISLSRFNKRFIMILFDSFAVIFILLLAFSIRFGYLYFPEMTNSEGNLSAMFWVIISAPFIAIPIFQIFDLYRSIIRYIGLKSLAIVVQAVSLYAVIWGLITYMFELPGIPRSAIIINWMLAVIFIGGSRLFARWYLAGNIQKKNKNYKKKVLIYGAGSVGMQLSITIGSSNEFDHIAFIDDSKSLHGRQINGIKVFPSSSVSSLVEKKNIDEILLAIPSLTLSRRKEIITYLSSMEIPVRIIPSMLALAHGELKVEDLREVVIEDLLGRESIPPNEKLLNLRTTGKAILVTGAGGSIGSELSRQLIMLKPKRIILYDINEYSLYKINSEIELIDNLDVEFFPVLGSVQDKRRLSKVCQHFSIQVIYHAAAYKHVPMVEYNTSEGVLNNIIGTLIASEVAIKHKVETFVFISTDKAVRPTNTMGATKRSAELILQAQSAKKHNTCFTMVRFGNVLDSSGSVIPLFRKQIKSGGPVTVTDINIVRYFMTKTEAIELVIQAGAMSKGGDVFVLDMGEPIRIDDLARKMIQLSGLKVIEKDRSDGDIEIKYIGLRPGEKLYEELLVGGEVTSTDNPLIMRSKEDFITWDKLLPNITRLADAAKDSQQEEIRRILKMIIKDFTPQCEIEDHLFDKK